MKVEIRIEPAQRGRIRVGPIRQAAETVLRQAGVPARAALSIVVTGDEDVRALNQQYMGSDEPTDVLSFPSGEPLDPQAADLYLGDIIISLPRAALQAETGGHELVREVELLTIHGCLHLLGHDHADAAEKAGMWAAQAAALAALGNPLSPP